MHNSKTKMDVDSFNIFLDDTERVTALKYNAPKHASPFRTLDVFHVKEVFVPDYKLKFWVYRNELIVLPANEPSYLIPSSKFTPNPDIDLNTNPQFRSLFEAEKEKERIMVEEQTKNANEEEITITRVFAEQLSNIVRMLENLERVKKHALIFVEPILCTHKQ